jgi:hypothetical protein
MRIRQERAEDRPWIERVHRTAVPGAGRAVPEEAHPVARLRADGNAVLSLLADTGRRGWGMACSRASARPSRPSPWRRSPCCRSISAAGSAMPGSAMGSRRPQLPAGRMCRSCATRPTLNRCGFDAALAAGCSTPFSGTHLMLRPLGGDLPVRSGRIAYPPAFTALA